MKRRCFVIIVLFGFLVLILSFCFQPKRSINRPNIIFILTDDQDVTLGGMTPLVKTKEYFFGRGVTFLNAFTAVPVCCPSRASILTGLYQHNHKVLNNSVNGNCYGNEWKNEHERRTFATYLKDSGYLTFYAGKYMNQYGRTGPEDEERSEVEVPLGWDHWHGLIGNSVYYNYSLSVNGRIEVHGSDPDDYLTDLINERASRFLLDRDVGSEPFFMMLSTPACHAPFQASVKYEGAYGNLKAPRTPNFNMSGGPDKHWLLRQTPNVLPTDSVRDLDQTFGKRWATLLSVDDLVLNIVNVLRAKGILDNTYLFFASDNGYHLGENATDGFDAVPYSSHVALLRCEFLRGLFAFFNVTKTGRGTPECLPIFPLSREYKTFISGYPYGQFSLPIDKRQMYEFDVKVPLFISGPGIKYRGSHTQEPVVTVDLAPTFLNLAGIKVPSDMDGKSLAPLLTSDNLDEELQWRSSLLIEYHGEGREAGELHGCPQYRLGGVSQCFPDCICEDAFNNTYTCLRTITMKRNLIRCEFRDNENFVEVYDLNVDPHQLHNLVVGNSSLRSWNVLELDRLRTCRGQTCHSRDQHRQS